MRDNTNYKVVDNNNEEYLIDNLILFCEEKGISYKAMVRVANGYARSHQGYWITHIDPEMYEQAKLNRKGMKISTKKRSKDEITTMINVDTGEEVSFDHLTEFCEERGLNKGAISLICKGIRKNHKGWQLKED